MRILARFSYYFYLIFLSFQVSAQGPSSIPSEELSGSLSGVLWYQTTIGGVDVFSRSGASLCAQRVSEWELGQTAVCDPDPAIGDAFCTEGAEGSLRPNGNVPWQRYHCDVRYSFISRTSQTTVNGELVNLYDAGSPRTTFLTSLSGEGYLCPGIDPNQDVSANFVSDSSSLTCMDCSNNGVAGDDGDFPFCACPSGTYLYGGWEDVTYSFCAGVLCPGGLQDDGQGNCSCSSGATRNVYDPASGEVSLDCADAQECTSSSSDFLGNFNGGPYCSSSDQCPSGTVYGEINVGNGTQPLCVVDTGYEPPEPPEEPATTTTSSTDTTSNPDGSTTETTTETTTNSDGSTSVTTTTNNYDSSGNLTSSASACTGDCPTNNSGSGNGTGEGGPSGFSGSASDDCDVAPSCSGSDALECAILTQSWHNLCASQTEADALADVDSALDGFTDVRDIADDAIANGFQFEETIDSSQLGISTFADVPSDLGACIEDVSIDLFGATITIPVSEWCQIFNFAAILLRITATILGSALIFQALTGLNSPLARK